MQDSVTLEYNIKNKYSWDEKISTYISLSDINDYTQITKILSALVGFLTRIGYNSDDIIKGYQDILSQLTEKSDINSKEITDMTFEEFQLKLSNESFQKYLYSIFIED